MIKEVSFPIAKLLKEKGFDRKVRKHYESNGNRFFDNVPCNFNNVELICSAPTIADVVMWLYEKHGIWISIDTDINGKFKQILRKHNSNDRAWGVKITFSISKYYNSPTEAYEAAIEYILNDL